MSRTPRGQNTTCPVGTRVAPVKPAPVGVELLKVRAAGSNIPTFDEPTLAVAVSEGAKMTFPDGVKHPPPKKDTQLALDCGICIFEQVNVLGFITNMFEFWGTPATFPFGVITRPLNPAVPTYMLDPARVTGLY